MRTFVQYVESNDRSGWQAYLDYMKQQGWNNVHTKPSTATAQDDVANQIRSKLWNPSTHRKPTRKLTDPHAIDKKEAPPANPPGTGGAMLGPR